jgi:hypothetical protein
MSKRYAFDGFTFGDNETQLEITMLKPSGFGYTSQFRIELTSEEREELIEWLQEIGEVGDN